MIYQLQDQNRKLLAQIAAMNRENARRKNEASNHQYNGDLSGDEEENNTWNSHAKGETYETATTSGIPMYSGPLSEFIMSVAFQDNFKLPTTLKLYNGTEDLYVHVTLPLPNISHFLREDDPPMVFLGTCWVDPQLCRAFISICELFFLEPII